MAKGIQAIRGMNDILPTESAYWQWFEAIARDVMAAYGYQEIRFPIAEKTELFVRGIGEATDVVEKEMYSFEDKSGESVTLRPEGTASCVRAAMQHGLLHNQQQKLYYLGPMFRYERPQKGRYRQFHQFGVEVFGYHQAELDAEIIFLSANLFKRVGVFDHVTLHINSLGTIEERLAHRTALIAYLQDNKAVLDEDSVRRLEKNPLRILDSKNPAMQEMIESAPSLLDYLTEESLAHFERLKTLLSAAGLSYRVNPRLVRGLDYYSRTVFEWMTDRLGSQAAICAGGRYDGLVEQFGGKTTPAVGFGLGIERLLLLIETLGQKTGLENQPHIYCIATGAEETTQAVVIAEQLRRAFPGLRILSHCDVGSFKSQFKKADKSMAKLALVIGEDELAKETVTIKFLREQREQISCAQRELVTMIETILKEV
ncbi:histidine--tRNA ligase [Piscirickettsia litoralis]|uniref:Histidine--tRNA ligase n=1 Tax=Piscirickettsia litoralis TaxID=1891921 RepID=A0ABX3A4K8_9GAMM|nr:histidine--tRNA ligase [Piscirickettsia litoralis]ODN43801.1 histidine--tRNA ligase [Piscirickettsia litoralis]